MNVVFPWESAAMIESPWMMQCAIVGAAFALSILTWVRDRKRRK